MGRKPARGWWRAWALSEIVTLFLETSLQASGAASARRLIVKGNSPTWWDSDSRKVGSHTQARRRLLRRRHRRAVINMGRLPRTRRTGDESPAIRRTWQW